MIPESHLRKSFKKQDRPFGASWDRNSLRYNQDSERPFIEIILTSSLGHPWPWVPRKSFDCSHLSPALELYTHKIVLLDGQKALKICKASFGYLLKI